MGGFLKNLRNYLWRRDALVATVIFATAFPIFVLSPVRPFSDSAYTFVVSESLLRHQTFAIEKLGVPREEPRDNGSYVENGRINQLEWVGERLYYYLPPGTAILSIPYVALMDVFGWSVINSDGSYNIQNEISMQLVFASLLMALLGVFFYLTARLVLPTSWSAVIAAGGIFGTQVWSTLSASVWSDTWGVILIALVVFLLLSQAHRKTPLRPVLLATLLAWAYVVRPTNSISIVALGFYVLAINWRHFVRYVLTAGAWLSLLVAYSWYHFRHILPNYYRANRLTFEFFGEALAGNLISPARGLFVYLPIVLFVFYVLARYRKHVVFRRLMFLSLTITIVHWIATSGFGHWYGGGSYGPRLMAGTIPWLFLLTVIAIHARLKARSESTGRRTATWRLETAAGALLLMASIAMNGIGATMPATILWNDRPVRIDRDPSRLWDWRYPQFLAPFVHPPRPKVFPPADVRIECGLPTAEPYLWYGWRVDGGEFRWTDGREATLVFTLDEPSDVSLQLKLRPFIVTGKLEQQRVTIAVNNRALRVLTLADANPHEYSLVVPKALLQQNNVLSFDLPDASSPKALGLNNDGSKLAMAVYWIEIRTPNANSATDTSRHSVATAPLPNGGYAAGIKPIDVPAELNRNQAVTVRVAVKNISGVVWAGDGQNIHQAYRVRVGNHWRDASGHLVLLDDGRAALPYDLRPGREVELQLTITAPATAGNYLLEFDVVQERVTWFADQDSRTIRIPIVVK